MKEKNYLLAKKYIIEYLNGIEIPDDLSFEVSSKIYCFKENFLKLVGKNPFNADIRDYREKAIEYLNNTYPYCFALVGSVERFFNIDEALKFYAKSIGASNEQIEQIIDMLKEIKMPNIETETFKVQSVGEEKEYIFVDSICGSTIPYYRADNLYAALLKVSDKNLQGFINYLVVNNVFNPLYTERVMDGISCYRDENNNLMVSEGNHRVLTLKALMAIREFVNGTQEIVPGFKATVVLVTKNYTL